MYIVIACARCRQSFQVAEASLEKTVECPLCGQPTLARTVEPVLPVARELPAPETPLSLDDAPALPRRRRRRGSSLDSRQPSRFSTPMLAFMSLLLTLAAMGAVYFGFRWWKKDPLAWQRFTSPNHAFTVLMPGNPREEEVLATGFGNLGGKRYTTAWETPAKKSGEKAKDAMTEVSAGWIDLDADKLRGVQFDQIAIPFRQRESERLEGRFKVDAAVGFVSRERKYEAREYELETDRGLALLRIYILAGDPRQRLFFLLAHGPDVSPKEEWVMRFFNSFDPE